MITLNIFKRVDLGLLIPAFILRYHRQSYRNRDYESIPHHISRPQPVPHQRKRWLPKLLGAIFAFLFVAAAFLYIYGVDLHDQTQHYLEIRSDILVAQIHVMRTELLPHNMTVQLKLFDNEGHPFYDQKYINGNIPGDNLLLGGDVITFSPEYSFLGLHEEFRLASLAGHYQDSKLESTSKPGAMPIDGGNDNFFKSVQNGSYPGVTAAYSNSVTLPADGNTYDVFMSQNGLFIKRAN